MSHKDRPFQQNNPPASAGPRIVGLATQGFSGPIPHPEILKGYETICPGAAERIIKMAELEQGHRHGIESKGLKAQIQAELLLRFHSE